MNGIYTCKYDLTIETFFLQLLEITRYKLRIVRNKQRNVRFTKKKKKKKNTQFLKEKIIILRYKESLNCDIKSDNYF